MSRYLVSRAERSREDFFLNNNSSQRELGPPMLKSNIVLIVSTPLICVVTMVFKVLYKSILHSSVHSVTASILYIALPFGSIITI